MNVDGKLNDTDVHGVLCTKILIMPKIALIFEILIGLMMYLYMMKMNKRERGKASVMRVTETKEITKVVKEEVTVKRICDNCGNEITLWDRLDEYNYFLITTHHHDWGNDSIDSYEYYDACCPKCALEMAEKYLANAYKEGYNTKTIEIEHVRGLRSGTDRDYKHNIEED